MGDKIMTKYTHSFYGETCLLKIDWLENFPIPYLQQSILVDAASNIYGCLNSDLFTG